MTPYPDTLNILYFNKNIDFGDTNIPQILSLEINCKGLKLISGYLFCKKSAFSWGIHKISIFEGKASPSTDFVMMDNVSQFQLIYSSKEKQNVEIIYVPANSRGLYRRQLAVQGGTLNDSVELVESSKTIFKWVNCKNGEKLDTTILCAYGGIGSDITWGSYDSTSEVINFQEEGQGLRVSRIGSKGVKGFYGNKYIL